MNATLTEPIVTDYVPVARPPWLVVALAVAFLALVMPRAVVIEFVAASVLVAAVLWFVDHVRTRRAARRRVNL